MFVSAALFPAAADFNMNAGPIWNQGEAQAKCTKACAVTWNGNWTTTVPGKMSICSVQNKAADGQTYVIMDAKGGLEAGPIWNQGEAKGKCDAAAGKVKWNGQWTTTVPGKMSVCGCTGTATPWK
jgi:hypothetical protein